MENRTRRKRIGTPLRLATVKEEEKSHEKEKIARLSDKPKNSKEALRQFALEMIAKDCKEIENEFLTIRTDMIYEFMPKIAFNSNPEKNRYNDVSCIDETRVKLTYPAGTASDYIHANYVSGLDGETRYICTQGPLPNTVNDFWRMIWQEKCKSIVMLCNTIELDKKRCVKYWPDEGEPLELDCDLKVIFMKMEAIEPHLIVRKLKVQNEAGEEFITEHIQWKDWPDRGVPVASMSLFRLLAHFQNLTPSVVHCSAGIGRTGTIISLDLANNHLMVGNVPRIEEIVRKLREQRHGSVQTDVQYLFIHRLLLLAAVEREAVTTEEVAAFIEKYEKWMASKL